MIYALCLEYDFVDIVLDSFIELIEKFLTDFEPSVLFDDYKHGNISFSWVCSIVVPNYAANNFVLVISHYREIGPIGKKIVVSID